MKWYVDKELEGIDFKKIPAFAYVLNQTGGNYYIGMTNNITRRMKSHFKEGGSMWTKKHPATSINSIYACKSV